MTDQWQFPAWEDMKEIDVTRPLVTRDGRICAKANLRQTHTDYIYEVNIGHHLYINVTRKGQYWNCLKEDLCDIQNPAEWAYEQFGIEPLVTKEIHNLRSSITDQQCRINVSNPGTCDRGSKGCTVDHPPLHVEQSVYFVEQLATEPCRAPSYDLWKGNDTPCGKCASCRARAITGGDMPPLRRRGDGTSYRCQHCGQSEV